MPAVAEGVAVRWLDPAAPWAAQVGAVPTSTRYAAGIVATVDLLFDDTKADLRHTEQVECVLFPLADPPDVASLVAVDHDPRDLLPDRARRGRLPAPRGEGEDEGACSPTCSAPSSTTCS